MVFQLQQRTRVSCTPCRSTPLQPAEGAVGTGEWGGGHKGLVWCAGYPGHGRPSSCPSWEIPLGLQPHQGSDPLKEAVEDFFGTNKGQGSPSRKHMRSNLQREMPERPLDSFTDTVQIPDTAVLLPRALASYPGPLPGQSSLSPSQGTPWPETSSAGRPLAAPEQPFSPARLMGPPLRWERLLSQHVSRAGL